MYSAMMADEGMMLRRPNFDMTCLPARDGLIEYFLLVKEEGEADNGFKGKEVGVAVQERRPSHYNCYYFNRIEGYKSK